MKSKSDRFLERAPWFVTIIVSLRHHLKEVDPLRMALWVIGVLWIALISILILLPFYGSGTLDHLEGNFRLTGAFTGFGITFWIGNIFTKHVKDRKCVVALDSKTFYVDNRNVQTQPNGEQLFVVNKYGNPIYNTNEKDIRYMQQKTMHVPAQVLSQFGSALEQPALSFSNCKVREVNDMEDTDFVVTYSPRRLQEFKLIRENHLLSVSFQLQEEISRQLEISMTKVVKTFDVAEKDELKHLIELMSSIRSAYYGTPEQLREQLQFSRFNSYDRPHYGYNPYPYYNQQPSWRDSWMRHQQQPPEEEEGTL